MQGGAKMKKILLVVALIGFMISGMNACGPGPGQEGGEEGTIASLSADSSSFTLRTDNDGDWTVNVTDKTAIYWNNGSVTKADLTDGQRVKVEGIFNEMEQKIFADKITIQ